MAAVFTWKESNLVGEVVSTAAKLDFGSVDDHDLNTTTYPITKNTNSFTKYIRGLFTGSWTTISNIKFWKSAGAYVTGEDIHAAANATYATPTATGMGGSTIPTTEGTALALNSAEGDATIDYGESGVSGYTGYVKLQLQTTASTPSGAVNQKTFCLQYDEV